MGEYLKHNTLSVEKRITLSSLKEQLYTLNMRMLLAIQSRDEEAQEEIRRQIDELQTKIKHLSLGGKV